MFNKVIKLAAHARSHMAVLAGTALLCCSFIETAQALPYSHISQVYFFGDSLTDSGFYNALPFVSPYPFPPGKAPTFTTYGGYTWSQYVAHDIKGFVLPVYPTTNIPNPPDTITNNTSPLSSPEPVIPVLTGVDYAAGGSSTNSTGLRFPGAPSLHTQIARFMSTAPRPLDSKAVYFIWSGANDFLKLLSQPIPPTQLQLLAMADTAAKNIAGEVALLSANGAKRVVVLSLPNIGYTPLIGAAAVHNPSLPATVKTATFTFNSMLNQQLGKVVATYGTKILYVDVYDALDNVILATQAGKPYVVAGQSFQFVNYTQPACGNVPLAIFCPPGTPTGYVFADSIHPTGMAHRVLSLIVETQIQKWV